jgi:hypothetical protein
MNTTKNGKSVTLKLGMTVMVLSFVFVAQDVFAAKAKKPYKVSQAKEKVIGAEKIADPSAVKIAVIGPIVEERAMKSKKLPGSGIYTVSMTGARTEYLTLADTKAQNFGTEFSEEFAKRYGSAPVPITSATRDLDKSKISLVVTDITRDFKFIGELAELSKEAGAGQFILLSTGVEVTDVNQFSGKSGTIVLYLYATVFDNNGKQVRKILISGVTAEKVDPEDGETFAGLLDKAKDAIPEVMDTLFAAK